MNTAADLDRWLDDIGLSRLSPLFKENAIGLDVLPDITDSDLREIGVRELGDRKRLLRAIAALGAASARRAPAAPPEPGPAKGSADAPVERRHMSLLFVDLVGSTALAARLDPEEMGSILQLYRATCEAVIEAHGGVVNNHYGDGTLALFGYPAAREDDADHAVRCALRMVAAVADLEPPVGASGPARLAARAAVASGVVVIGRLDARDDRSPISVVGETPNLAARIQAFAEPGGVVVSDETRRLIGARFRTSEPRTTTLRGFDGQQRVWRVEAENEIEARFLARASAVAPMIGRRAEFQRIMALWRAAASGAGRVAIVLGEAGIGKSRLCFEAARAIEADGGRIVRLQGVDSRSGSALFPVLERIERMAGSSTGHPPAERAAKLRAFLAGAGRGDAIAAALVTGALGLDPGDDVARPELDPAALRRALLRASFDVLRGATDGPVALVVEDAHWLDPSSLDWLEHAASEARGQPVLLLATSRPGRDFAWADAPHVSTIGLARLDEIEARALVRGVAGPAALDEAAISRILARTDGVPLFVEECARLISEAPRAGGAVGRTGGAPIEIPATIHDLLLARIDKLGEAKATVQLAACLGRRFARDLLIAVAATSEASLDAHLLSMTDAGLVRQTEDDGAFVFKHALIQDAAMGSLTLATRRRVHRMVAETLEAGGDAAPEILAQHWGEAGFARKALDCWVAAARGAMAASAFREAASHYRSAIARAALLGGEAGAIAELELQIALAVPLTLTEGWASGAVRDAYVRARELCDVAGTSAMRHPAASGVFNFYLVTGRHVEAKALADSDLALARASGDPGTVLEFELNAGVVRVYGGRPTEARPYLLRSAGLYDRRVHAGNLELYGKVPATVALAHLGMAYAAMAQPAAALDCNRRSVAEAVALGHEFGEVWGRSCEAITFLFNEDHAAARDVAASAFAQAERRGFVPWVAQTQVWLGRCMASMREPERGVETIREGIALWARIGLQLVRPYYHTLLAEALQGAGRFDEAAEAASEALRISDETGERWTRPSAMTRLALLDLARGRTSEAEADAALARASRLGAQTGAMHFAIVAEVERAALAQRSARRFDPAALAAALASASGAEASPLLRRAAAVLETAREGA